VIVDESFADLEVVRLDALLRARDALGDERVRDDFALLHPEAVHHAGDAVGAEQAHEIVFERDEELGFTRVALAAGATAQLPVDTPRLVALGADDVQTARHVFFAFVGVDGAAVLGRPVGAPGADTAVGAAHHRRLELDVG